MASLNPQMSLDEIIKKMRDDMIRTQSDSQTTAITAFDSLVSQLRIYGAKLNDNNIEIKRLQELCRKNDIDFAISPEKPKVETEITPVVTTKSVPKPDKP